MSNPGISAQLELVSWCFETEVHLGLKVGLRLGKGRGSRKAPAV